MEVFLSSFEVKGYIVVEVVGDLDVYTGVMFREFVTQLASDWRHPYPFAWVFDLRRLTFLDSTSLGPFTGLLKSTIARFGQRQYTEGDGPIQFGRYLNYIGQPIMTLVVAGERFLKIFRITALDQFFNVVYVPPELPHR
jgi:anti-anti-sigma factor